MVQVQLNLTVKARALAIELNILEREDASDLERELARRLQTVYLALFDHVRERLPDVDVAVEILKRKRDDNQV